jgi:hypothetical protein
MVTIELRESERDDLHEYLEEIRDGRRRIMGARHVTEEERALWLLEVRRLDDLIHLVLGIK